MQLLSTLLNRAWKVFRHEGTEPPLVEPFELPCTCGGKVRGYRHEHRQFVRCSECGHVRFVLPLSPYPVPPPPAPPDKPEPKPREGKKQKRRRSARQGTRSRQPKERAPTHPGRLVPRKQWFTRGRLLTLAVLAVVAVTVWQIIELRGRERLTEEMLTAAWTTALEQGDFLTAAETLNRVTRLLERYGTGGPEEREIWHLASEVNLYADRLDQTLEELLHDVRSMTPERRATYLETVVGNGSLLLDLPVDPAPRQGNGPARPALPLVVGGDPVHLDLAELKLVADLDVRQPKRILFGAKILSVDPASEPAGGWVLRFVPDSGVLLTWPVCLEQAGWPIDETTQALLEAQRRWVLERP